MVVRSVVRQGMGHMSARWIVPTVAIALFVASCDTASVTSTTGVSPSPTVTAPVPTSGGSPAPPSLITNVNDAAAQACADGSVGRDDIENYKETLRDLLVDPSSALSRTAVIVECGLSTDEVLDLLP